MTARALRLELQRLGVALVLAALLGVVDWWTGYELNFFVFYFLPIAFAAWRSTLEVALAAAVFSALVWAAADQVAGSQHSSDMFAIWNTMIRLAAFVSVAWSVHRAAVALDGERRARRDLEQTLSELRVLRGLLSICAECKKIRNDDGLWQPVESYVVEHTDALFSHGYCPGCAHQAMVEAGLAEPGPRGPAPRSTEGGG